MTDQPGLPGIEAADAVERHNLFFALRPDAATAECIAAVARRLFEQHRPGGYLLPPPRYHVTLPYLGEHAVLPPALVRAALAAGASVRSAPFVLPLDLAGSFSNVKVPWWLGTSERSAALDVLFRAIAAPLGLRFDPEAFRPHLTIVRNAARQLPLTPIEPIAWTVDEFVLIDSRVRPRPLHTVIGRWRL